MTKPKQKQISEPLKAEILRLATVPGPARDTGYYLDRLRKIRELLEGVK